MGSREDSQDVACPKAKGQKKLALWFPAESDRPTFTGKARLPL